MIRICDPSDAAQVCRIYNPYVLKSVATFEDDVISAHDMAQRISSVIEHLPWLVWEESGEIVGYAYATPWKSRPAYRHTVESTIYLEKSAVGHGIGTRLYRALIDELQHRNVHCVLAGIALPNPSSIALHEKLGFTKVGQLREVGYKFGQWIDVGYWQLVL